MGISCLEDKIVELVVKGIPEPVHPTGVAFMKQYDKTFADDPKADLLDLYRAGMTGIKDSVRHKMKLFGSVGKA